MARALLLLAVLLILPWPASAGEWGNIEPGITTPEEVRARYGEPSKETSAKVEGYDTRQWIYEGSRAPEGLVRMTVDFGLLTSRGYQPALVRLLKLEPKPLIFGRHTVIDGWGLPDNVSNRDGFDTFFYRVGLFVIFDKEGTSAVTMVFSIPQPEPAAKSAPAPPPSAAPTK
jgi:hypothetical protein